ncbi:hypothetical protein EAG_15312 [Camponotus floridanus]|uniref:Centrosomal protein of 57 kDa n=1 Tax=Camponotus floridanus TaxID=104421 RepID=E2AHW5_CAMFO|nr:hypothetical protein EAG_15312 [Camponotus floridanus]
MGQELDKAETKCFTLKSELNYVMGVCQKVKSEMKGTKEKSDISLKPIRSSSENPSLKFSIEHNDHNSEIMSTNKIPNYNYQKIYNVEHKAEDFDTLYSKSAQLSPRGTVVNDDIIEESDTSKYQKQNGLLNVTIKPKASRGFENSKSFPEYLGEHLQSMLNIEDSIKELTSNENYLHAIPSNSAKRNITDAELNLNIPDTIKVRRTEKSKRVSRLERSESNSVYNKSGDALSKMRKKKGRLRNSISKSTVTTKDTSLIGRREAKRRRQRGLGVNNQSNLLRNSKKSKDVVEIFHNTILKSSNSAISNKYSKFDKQTKCVKRHPSEIANQKIQETVYPECANREYKFDNKENEQYNQYHQSSNCDSEMIPEKVQEHKSEKYSKDLYSSAQCKTHQSEHNAFNKCNDPMFTPSYEMPTLASRLKRSNRSYFSRFNFRNIPFVVGTSITPSHNLGLNIQQVLGAMKTRQPITNDITPLLVRKVSKGIPMSSLLEQINGHSERSTLSLNSHLTGIFNNCESSHINRDKKLSVLDLQHVENTRMSNVSGNAKMIPEKDNNIRKQYNKEKINSYCKIKQQSPILVNKSNTTSNIRNLQGVSKASSNKETNIGDYKMRTITGTHNSKEIRNILINLHDQFEEMNTKYEKLQSEMEKSKDKSLAKELSAMEKELNVKEEEINVVIGLYKEVMMLKQQMKMLHEKNSLVCITTESTKGSHKNPFPISILSGKSHSMNPTQIFGRRKFNATREPPTSMQLAALLRQIQTFHKQIQLVS